MEKWAKIFTKLVDWYYRIELAESSTDTEENEYSVEVMEGEIERCFAEMMSLYEQGVTPFDQNVYSERMLRAFLQESGLGALRMLREYCWFQHAIEQSKDIFKLQRRLWALQWTEWMNLEPNRHTFYSYAKHYIESTEEYCRTQTEHLEEVLSFADLLSEVFLILLPPELESLIAFTFEDVPNVLNGTLQKSSFH